PNDVGPAGFGSYCDVGFTWGTGSLKIKGSISRFTFYIDAYVYVTVPFWGDQQVLHLSGSLKEGVSGSFNKSYASGSVELHYQNGSGCWAKLDVTSPFFETIKGDYLVLKF
ncbi:unnamed protein product, partial [Rhizoctonia solani]